MMLKVKTDLWDTLYIYSDLMIMDMDGGKGRGDVMFYKF